MRHLRLLRFTVSALAVACLCACGTGRSYYKVLVSPDPAVQERMTPSGEAVTFEQEGIWGAVRAVGREDLAHPSSLNREWSFPNPFEGVYGEEDMPIAFYLLLENRSGASVTFNPTTNFTLLFGGAPLFSIDYDDLYQDLYTSREGEARLKRIRAMLFRSYVTLHPGEGTRGLLLFRRPRAETLKNKPLLLRLGDLYTGRGTIEFVIPFRIDMEKVKIPES